MYSLLLVDDEKLEVETLRDYIEWENMGIHPVYIARNGKDAYDKVMELKPDIMITDIHMPVMNGVELTKKLFEERATTKIIFLTGYDDFEYVKSAFKVEAIDYILKPFSIESIQNAIQKVSQVLDKEQVLKQSIRVLERKLLQAIFDGKEENRKTVVEQFIKIKNNQPEIRQFGVIQAIGDTEKIDTESIEGKFAEILYAIKEENRITFLVLYFVDFLDSTKRIAKYYGDLGIPAIYLYSNKQWGLEELYLSYAQYGDCSRKLFYESSNTIREVTDSLSYEANRRIEKDREIEANNNINSEEEFHKENMKKVKEVLRQTKINQNFERIEQFCLEQFEVAKQYKLERNSVLEVFTFLFADIYEVYVEENAKLKELIPHRGDIRNRMYLAINIEELENIIFQYLQLIREHIEIIGEERNSKDKNAYVVQSVKKYINQNYAKTITIELMAEEIGLSPNYVRNIFKERTGVTITEWITEYRLEEACLLLKEDKLKVKQISYMVGYDNNSYFCSVFAKKYGLSPNEYRNRVIRS